MSNPFFRWHCLIGIVTVWFGAAVGLAWMIWLEDSVLMAILFGILGLLGLICLGIGLIVIYLWVFHQDQINTRIS